MNDLIQVKQLPVIEEQLRSMKEQVEARTAEAMSLVCTEETVTAVKKARAELNNQFAELEEQRKAVKKAVMDPWEKFEAVYKECVSLPFKAADADLKNKIGSVESELKQRCEDGLREYFAALAAAEHVEWLEYERAGIVVDMASAKAKTPKKLREQIAAFVTGVARGVEVISSMEDAEEIMVEFRRCLDAAQAIGIVQDRHQRVEAERKAAEERKAALEAQRQAVQRVEAVAPPTVLQPPVQRMEKPEEKVYRCPFTVIATKPQLQKLKAFLVQEGIKYE